MKQTLTDSHTHTPTEEKMGFWNYFWYKKKEKEKPLWDIYPDIEIYLRCSPLPPPHHHQKKSHTHFYSTSFFCDFKFESKWNFWKTLKNVKFWNKPKKERKEKVFQNQTKNFKKKKLSWNLIYKTKQKGSEKWKN